MSYQNLLSLHIASIFHLPSAMKTQFQTLSFLSNYTPKSSLDAEVIESFLDRRFQICPQTLRNPSNFDANGLDVKSFISWFESGVGCLKMARLGNSLVILGNCALKSCEIIGTLLENGTISTEILSVDPNKLENVTEEEITIFQQALKDNHLQPSPQTLRLVPKYIPQPNERVIFYNFTQETQGVGVIREINAEGDVIFYCYFTYPTYSHPKHIGYSMHEAPGFNIRSFVFECIDKENLTTTLGNSTSCFRRLGRELEKVGKIWKDKLLRVEDAGMKASKDEPYFYITDKLTIAQDTERLLPTSHQRYLAGNYFKTKESAEEFVSKLKELIKDYLATPNKSQI